MVEKRIKEASTTQKEYKVLVAVDFSACSANALKNSKLIMGRKPDRIIVLYVIDHDFIERCVASRLGKESQIKKILFMEAKKKLKQFLQTHNMMNASTETEVCEGTPFLEIILSALTTLSLVKSRK